LATPPSSFQRHPFGFNISKAFTLSILISAPVPVMATPELAIAKAALSASLFRADPASTSRPSVDNFLQQTASTLAQCSRPNVQVCLSELLSRSFARSLAQENQKFLDQTLDAGNHAKIVAS
jgi:hypothetical protein